MHQHVQGVTRIECLIDSLTYPSGASIIALIVHAMIVHVCLSVHLYASLIDRNNQQPRMLLRHRPHPHQQRPSPPLLAQQLQSKALLPRAALALL